MDIGLKDQIKKEFKQADRSWMSTSVDYNNDGFIDSVGIEKVVGCKRDDISKPFSRSGVTVEMKLFFTFLRILKTKNLKNTK